MKIVINTSYGKISEESAGFRFDPQFIEDVETGRFVGRVIECAGFSSYAETLKVIEIPDEATDCQLVEYDGCEGIFYVLGGKLHYVGSDEFHDRCIVRE